MNKILATLLCSTVIASSAFANAGPTDQLPSSQKEAKSPFEGFKIGLQTGIGFSEGNAKIKTTNNLTNLSDELKADKSGKGFLGGIHAGYDFVCNNNVLLGVETFLDLNASKGKLLEPSNSNRLIQMKADSDWTIGITGRVGYVMDRAMTYVGLGWVGTDWSLKTRLDSTQAGGSNFNFKDNKFTSGIRFAAGMAMEVAPKVILGVEGSYTIYKSIKSRKNFSDSIGGFGASATANTKYSPDILDVKIKLSYKI